jgi:membrane associated rhomboid family serine protease
MIDGRITAMGIYDRPYYQDEQRRLPAFTGRSMVVNLIIVNVAVYIVDAFFFGTANTPYRPIAILSVEPDTLLKPWMWWQFLTYGFCHHPGNIGHILSNMLGLFFLGQDVEQHYGSKLFLRMYLTALIVGSVLWSATELALGHKNSSLIGASGAVMAVTILFAMNFPRRTILFMMFIPMPAWLLGALLVAYNVLGVQSDTLGDKQIAYSVHLAGAAYALLFFRTHWALGGWPSLSRVPRVRWPRRKPNLRVHDPESRHQLLDEQADAVLDKLHREGLENLTARERRILEEYSRRMQQKRR